MEPKSKIESGVSIGLIALAFLSFCAALLNAFGITKIATDDGTKFLLSFSALLGVIVIFKERITKVILPGGITAELQAVKNTVENVAAATNELKLRQTEIAAPKMSSPTTAGTTSRTLNLSVGTVEDPEDKNKGRFGGSPTKNGLTLSASVRESELRPGWFRVDLLVTAKNRALTKPVEFHLHETFAQPNQLVKPVDDTAQLTVLAWGAFTVGVVADDGSILLELNLADDPSFPKAFREK